MLTTISSDIVINTVGNFPWLLPLKHVISKFSETSKSIATLETFALDLIKERRKKGYTSKVGIARAEHFINTICS